jgi:hypothetical protein
MNAYRFHRDLPAFLLSCFPASRFRSFPAFSAFLSVLRLLRSASLPLRPTLRVVIPNYPRPGQRSKKYDPAKRASRIDREKFPLSIAAGRESFTQFEERFNHGVELILRGAHAQN